MRDRHELDQLEIIANLRYGKAAEEHGRNIARERKEKMADLAARGLGRSGAMMRAITTLSVKQVELNCASSRDIWVDLLTRKYGRLLKDDVDFICARVDVMVRTARESVTSIFGNSDWPESALRVSENHLRDDIDTVAMVIRRDLEILRREQEELPMTKEPAGVTNIYHLHGASSRVNVQSQDQSINVVTLNEAEIFHGLRDRFANAGIESHELALILDKIDALEKSTGTRDFGRRYTEFIAVAANHIQLIAPLLPALAEMLGKTL